ncbi:MAG: DNA topoisomerase 3 [Alphaproteobacteria bacterium]
MGKRLIICEKGSVQRDVVTALPGKFKKVGDLFESDEYVVAAASGHLVEQLEPDEYDPRFKRWRFEDLPIIPETPQYSPREDRAAKQLAVLHKAMKRKDVDVIVNACDAGREGELIFKLIYETAGVDKPVERAWFSSMTKGAIREAFSHLRDDAQMKPLESAARARETADWLVGYNATRAATVKVGSPRNPIPLGRVKTPTLALIARRDEEIAAFVPVPYWEVDADFTSQAGAKYDGKWFRGTQKSLPTADEAESVAAAVRAAATGRIVRVEKKPRVEQPRLLFDLTQLQREANGRFGFTAKRTLAAAQRLYDTYKLLTYPRTNSKYLTTDMIGSLRGIAANVGQASPEYAKAGAWVSGLRDLPLARVVADDKVGDHHAIIPTDGPQDLAGLGPDELKIYDLVARRFLAAFHPPARKEVTSVDTEAGGHLFRSSGTVIVEPGFLSVYATQPPPEPRPANEESEEESAEDASESKILPPLAEGETSKVDRVSVLAKETTPPRHYTENSLLRDMETAGRLVEAEELAEAMRDSGLGTPATRAQTIEDLIANRYVEREGRKLRATPKGLAVIRMLGDHDLTSPSLTGGWEHRLQRIQEGESSDAFMADIRAYTRKIVDWFASKDRSAMKIERRPIGPCPRCDGEIVEMPVSYSCTSYRSKKEPGCGYTIWRTQGTKEITPEEAEDLVRRKVDPSTLAAAGVRELGAHPETGLAVTARVGRFGPYVTEALPAGAKAGTKPRTASLLKAMQFDTVGLDDAVRLLSLPRTIRAADGEEILVANGRHGPYIKKGVETRSLGSEDDLFTLTAAQAEELLAKPKERRGRSQPATMAELGPDPATGKPIVLKAGRYGPYVTDGETNASLPRGVDPASLKPETAAELLAARREAAPSKRKRAPRKAAKSK